MSTDDNYKDPRNVNEYLEKLKTLSNIGEIKNFMNDVFPNWFITTMNSYCDDYPHLNKNWYYICNMVHTTPKKIIIVKEISNDENHKLIASFSECFTKSGFSVRKENEFISCKKCNKAVPTKEAWEFFKEKGLIKVPEVWRPNCINCS